MPHMTPHYEHATKWRLVQPNGEEELYSELGNACDAIGYDAPDTPANGDTYMLTCEIGWFARLSADGYMDATDWGGPFDTERAARDYIRTTYDVDPTSGESE